MSTARTLHVRCATWDQVDIFMSRKLRKGKLLSMKVPFATKVGAELTLGLELPNQLVIAIDGTVQRASPVETMPGSGDALRMWIEIELVGLTEDVVRRIKGMASGAEAGTTSPIVTLTSPRKPTAPPSDDLPADERELFQHLSSELRRLRQAAVHEVLGVARDAGPEDIRTGWKNLVRRVHPDLVARRGAPAITHLAEELTILSNRAYDRLRAALVVEGRATSAGPSMATPPGWLVGFEDIQSADATPAPPRPIQPRASTAPPAGTPPPHSPQGGEAFEQRARAMLAQGDANTAREVLAAALVVYPRSKPLRSLYYVATALAAIQGGEVMLAQSQLETALAHYEQCVEAAQMLEHIRRHGAGDADAMRRLFA
ncbi:MAG TPA: J domain-containing protein [Kofleriaceae bacterium]|nr:J domain-containing protein [Kofleriaceae bacterium]